jgi:hypothetical protein
MKTFKEIEQFIKDNTIIIGTTSMLRLMEYDKQ